MLDAADATMPDVAAILPALFRADALRCHDAAPCHAFFYASDVDAMRYGAFDDAAPRAPAVIIRERRAAPIDARDDLRR